MGARRLEMAESEIIFTVEEAAEGGYSARALGYAIHTQAETIEELRTMVQDAVRCHFDGQTKPLVIRLHWVKDEVIPA
jgi:predicted RNase H-like HicB family nuclease